VIEDKEARRVNGIAGGNLRKILYTTFNILPFGMCRRKYDVRIKGNIEKSLHRMEYLPNICDGGHIH
jgi:hypothetical protein